MYERDVEERFRYLVVGKDFATNVSPSISIVLGLDGRLEAGSIGTGGMDGVLFQ